MSHRIITSAILADPAEIRGVQFNEVLDLCLHFLPVWCEEHTRNTLAYKELAEFDGKHARQSSTVPVAETTNEALPRITITKFSGSGSHVRDLRNAYMEIGTFL
jgi:hypothetical protein